MRTPIGWIKEIFYGGNPRWETGYRRIISFSFRFTGLIVRELVHDRCILRSAALTFSTFLTLMPMIILSLVIFHAFGQFEKLRLWLETALFNHLLPDSVASVRSYIQGMVAGFDLGTVSFVSILFFIFSAYGMFSAVDSSLNAVWGVEIRRNILARMAHLWLFLTFFPPVIGYSLFLSAKILDYDPQMTGFMIDLKRHLLWSFPVLLTWLSLLLLYKFVPKASVRWDAAILGSFIAACLWEISKYGFNIYVKNMVGIQILYGSFLALPLFLLWVALSWLIILFGAECSYTYQHLDQLHLTAVHEQKHSGFSSGVSAQVGIFILGIMAKRFRSGEPPFVRKQLATKLRVPLNLIDIHILKLSKSGFVMPGIDGATVALTRDPSHIAVDDVLESYEKEAVLDVPLYLQRLWAAYQVARKQAMKGKSIDDLIDQVS